MILNIFIILFAVIVFGYIFFALIRRPSLKGNWTPDQAVLPRAKFENNMVSISDIRNCVYKTKDDYRVKYYDKTFDLDQLETVWYIVEPFAGHGMGAAHTFFSFGFADDYFISISVEIRKEKGDDFSPIKGLFRQYELMYVIADEHDVVKLRSNYRGDNVYVYPGLTTQENMRKLFVSMLERANKLAVKPEFYNTLTNSCTTNLAMHINAITPGHIPYSYKVLMPAYSDELAWELGLIDNTIPLDELRAKYLINEKALAYADDPFFSQRIRGWI
jgi:Domain of unknown function (DUF4105)